MKRGDLIFVRGNSLVSKLINRIDGEYSHVALALSEDTILEAQRFTESRIVKNYLVDYDVVSLNLTDEQLDLIVDSALKFIGYDYDYRQVVNTLFNNLFKIARMNNRNKFICSEIVVEILYDINYFKGDKDSIIFNSTPNELYDIITDRL